MKLVPPITVTTSNLTASNVSITETAWTAGTYNTGVQRYVGTTLYEVVATPSTTDEPTAGAIKDPPSWVAVGSINRFKMFDFSIGQATTKASPIEVTITPGEVINAVALFEVTGATTVQVEVNDPTDGLVYDETRTLADYTGIANWYDYFFAPYELDVDAVFLDLPAYFGAAITITITGSGNVSVGECILGRQRVYGSTAINTSLGIEDFSRKERDAFGNFEVVERRFAKLGNFDILLANSEVTPMFRVLADQRAKPTLYIGGDDFAETYILGFFRDFAILRSGPVTSELSIEVEGIV
jgi:hypothetical protein